MKPISKPPLSDTHPEIAAQADGWDPTTVTSGSGKKVNWKCNQDHVWQAAIYSRASGVGCPFCSGKAVLIGFNDFASNNPKLATQADGWDPTTVTAGSSKNLSWKCKLGHQWKATVFSRSKGTGCPYCSGSAVLAGINDLATINPVLAAQADGWDPTTVSPHTNKKLSWKCKHGHKWKATGNNRSNGTECPYCSGRFAQVGINDLATINPELAAEAVGWDPTTFLPFANKKVSWKCKLGHEWKAEIHSRSSGKGCPICSGLSILVGFNDLATVNPLLAAQADGWDPTTVTAGNHKKVGWKCEHGHQWKAPVYRRTSGVGCPICSGQAVLVGFNDLATTNPELAAQADGWDPTTVTASNHKKVGWKCEHGHQWIAVIYSRNAGSGCAICSGQAVLVGYNDLATINPVLAAQADGWDPTTVTAGTNQKVGWKCEHGHQWQATISSRTLGTGCPSCATSGFDPNQSGFLYLIDHFDLHMFQIGITNNPEDRLNRHARRGWEVIELRGPMDGHLTQQLETSCLHAIEKRGAVFGHKAGIKKFDGYSEAWTKPSLNVTSIKQLLDWVYEDEGSVEKI